MSENEFVTYNLQDEDSQKQKQFEKKPKAKKKRSAFAMILGGDFLSFEFIVGNITYIFFIIFLLILALAKNYYSAGLEKEIVEKQRSIDGIARDYVEAKSKLELFTQRVSLVRQLDTLGLKETKNATKVIRITNE